MTTIEVICLEVYFIKLMMTEDEFNENYKDALDAVIAAMAEEQEINPSKFYSLICVLENLRFFSPVLYKAIRNKKK